MEVSGVDLSQPQPIERISKLKEALSHHGILIFPGQQIT
jgi:hypothetical protein